MRKITIAFDVDGTLRNNTVDDYPVANERIRTLLITLASFKNTHIICWSGGGESYARRMAIALGVEPYIDEFAGKNLVGKDDEGHPMFDPEIQPDVAVDDIEACELGVINLIVKEK